MRRPTTGDELFLFIERDITERKLLVSQVVQSQRLESIGTLAGGIAHDLNNILAPIMMAGDLLEDRIADPEASQLLGLVKTNSRRGAELVRQILMFARGMEGPRVAVEATELIDEIRTFLAETLPKSIRLRVAVSADVKPILGDPSQLHQLLLNLCVNARDAMPSGGSLVISATPAHVSPSAPRPHPEAMPGDFIRLDIADSGSGIPDILKGQIFDPFFTTKGVGHGSGLGLSSARTIVKAHGGFMSFVSKEGLGTTFSIFLPAAAADVPRMPLMSAGNAGIAPARGNGERILVVDDEDSVRQIMRSTLEHFGFQVFASSEGAEALDLVRGMSERFALAIVDSQMPGMDGAQTIAALRGIEPELPVIISSGFAQDGNRRGGGAKATRHFLEKPFSVETLVAKVHEALGMPAA
jgi:nitrogen-specific signal transduction histidine kinase